MARTNGYSYTCLAAKKVAEGLKTGKPISNPERTRYPRNCSLAAKKVGHFAKEVGAKVAKFGLEVVSTAQSVAAKAAKFIPGIGKPISAALTGMSKATSVASDKIHANLGSKLQKGMDVMKKIQNPVGELSSPFQSGLLSNYVKVGSLEKRSMRYAGALFERGTAGRISCGGFLTNRLQVPTRQERTRQRFSECG